MICELRRKASEESGAFIFVFRIAIRRYETMANSKGIKY
jgi:hypothetical protein